MENGDRRTVVLRSRRCRARDQERGERAREILQCIHHREGETARNTGPVIAYPGHFEAFVFGGTVTATVRAPASVTEAAATKPIWKPYASDAIPAANATPTNCATRLVALLIPDASPSSLCCTLEITEAVSGVTKTANETPSSVIGPMTASISELSRPNAIQTKASEAPAAPAMSIARAPMESARLPNGRDSNPRASENGRNTSPASTGVSPRRSTRSNGSTKNMMAKPA